MRFLMPILINPDIPNYIMIDKQIGTNSISKYNKYLFPDFLLKLFFIAAFWQT